VNRLRTSWEIVRSSWAVLRQDKELLVLPVLSFLATVVVMGTFAAGFVAFGGLDGITDEGSTPGPGWYLAFFVMYLVLAVVTIFFNAALVHAANERLEGGDPTLGSALGGAASRFGALLPWALISATVSVILRNIQERSGLLGRALVGLVGVAWSLVTFLVLPVIVIEGVSVTTALRRAAELFRRTWGEQMAGVIGIGLVAFLAILVGVPLPLVLGLSQTPVLVGIGIGLFAAWVAVVATVGAALSGIFQAALYRYAAAGDTPAGFSPDLMSRAFIPRRG
jgi:hypothetical protein